MQSGSLEHHSIERTAPITIGRMLSGDACLDKLPSVPSASGVAV
jgi:hypothetical protein